MAKRPPKALHEGASFNSDGTFILPVCQALGLVQKRYASVCSKIATKTEDRDAWEKEFVKLKKGQPDRRERGEQLADAIIDLKQLRKDKNKLGGLFSRIVEGVNEGTLSAGMSPEDIIKTAEDGSGGEEGGGDEDEEEGGPQMRLTGASVVTPTCSWRAHFEAVAGAFGDREWGVVRTHVDKLGEDQNTPAKLAAYLAVKFRECKSSKDRRELLPTPPWFSAGLMTVLAKAGSGELCKADAAGEAAAADLLACLGRCAAIDVDAWLDLCGGKDAAANKLVLQASA